MRNTNKMDELAWYATDFYIKLRRKTDEELSVIIDECNIITDRYPMKETMEYNRSVFEITGMDTKLNYLQVMALLAVSVDILCDFEISNSRELFEEWLPQARKASETVC
jgi:hypothetical protein